MLSNSFASEALDKAQEAFLIQSGIQGYSDKIVSYIESQTIKKSTALTTGLTVYSVYRDKCVKFPYKDMFITIHTDKLEIKVFF